MTPEEIVTYGYYEPFLEKKTIIISGYFTVYMNPETAYDNLFFTIATAAIMKIHVY